MLKKKVNMKMVYGEPYLLSDEEIEIGDKFVFIGGDFEKCVPKQGYFICEHNDKGKPGSEFAKKIIALPKQIGLLRQRNGIGWAIWDRQLGYDWLLTENDIKEIIESGGECYVEMEDEFTNPEKYKNVGWGDGIKQLKTFNNKVIIHKK